MTNDKTVLILASTEVTCKSKNDISCNRIQTKSGILHNILYNL